MQAKPKIVKILVVALIVSLVLGACGGGTSGSTWFNLPSVRVNIQENGTAKIWGFNIGQPVLPPDVIQQLQSANIQQLEIRIGYNGVHLYTNGLDMPYLSWDEASVTTLQGVLVALPTLVPNASTIASLLPWLRTIGLGLALNIPLVPGESALDIQRWTGETTVAEETPSETTIGPLTVASIVFDETGEATIEGVPVSAIEQAMDTTLPLRLDPSVLAILEALDADSFKISTQPNGIDLLLNEDPLPGIAYDTARLELLLKVAGAFVQDPQTLALLNQIVPLLPGADVTLVVSFTGQPVAETDLGSITLVVTEDGAISSVMGLPLPPTAALPVDLVQNLQAANVQRLGVNLLDDGLAITANDQVLPMLSWTDESLGTVAKIAGPAADMSPEFITQMLDMLRGVGMDVKLDLPVAEGAEPVEIPEDVDLSMDPPDLGGMAPPAIRLTASYNDQGLLTSIGGLQADELAGLGVSLPALPLELTETLEELGVSEVKIATDPGVLLILLDGDMAIMINYDNDSLTAALDVAAPFMSDSALADPGVDQLLREQILPLAPGAEVEVTLTRE